MYAQAGTQSTRLAAVKGGRAGAIGKWVVQPGRRVLQEVVGGGRMEPTHLIRFGHQGPSVERARRQ